MKSDEIIDLSKNYQRLLKSLDKLAIRNRMSLWQQSDTMWITFWSAAAAAAAAKLLQLCLTLCDPIDGSPPGSAIPGILQARTLEWVTIQFSSVQSLSRV